MTLLEKIVSLGFSEERAYKLIKSGNVLVNEEVNLFPNTKINNQLIRIKEIKHYVSRGAYKLLKAIEIWNIDFNNKVVLDIGSSTGGFTQVALEHKANYVYALDVGTNQLDYSLRSNDKVKVLEKTNLKTITKEMFNKKIDIVITDVSFISLKHVFKVLEDFKGITLVVLIKPQFEANSNQVQSKGIVPNELHKEIIDKVKNYAKQYNFIFQDVKESPIKGQKSGNVEYLALFIN